MKINSLLALTACALLINGTAYAQAFSFANTTALTLPELSGATPLYPSVVTVAGVPVGTKTVSVTLNGLTHPFIADLGFVLRSPGGGTVGLMIGAGSPGAGTAASGAVLVFRDGAAGEVPETATLASGTYRPTNRDPGYSLPSPAPQSTYGTTLASVSGGDANGVWELFAANAGSDEGTLAGGWSIGFDVAMIPEVSAGWLFGAGLLALGGTIQARRCRKAV